MELAALEITHIAEWRVGDDLPDSAAQRGARHLVEPRSSGRLSGRVGRQDRKERGLSSVTATGGSGFDVTQVSYGMTWGFHWAVWRQVAKYDGLRAAGACVQALMSEVIRHPERGDVLRRMARRR
jgi:hypothetical protein